MTQEPEPTSGSADAPTRGRRLDDGRLRAARNVGLFALFVGVSLATLWPALEGPFLSDDLHIFLANPFTQELSSENTAAILDPRGYARSYTANYAPVHLLLHAVEVEFFGDRVRPYHLVNVVLHALNALLLVWLLRGSGVGAPGAILASLLFLVHPAMVEAVAWISQLKTTGAFALAAGALLAFRRRPGAATLLFACALATKATAAFALPTAAAFAWVRRGREGGSRRHWLWLALWTLVFALYSLSQISSFQDVAALGVPEYPDPWVQLRSVAAVGARYLAMAFAAYGVSAWQEPARAASPFDPWWLAALVAGALLSWRAGLCLVRRREEAAWWVSAAAAFAPVSQLFPFFYPVADRYLYFILPGLLGGALLWGSDLLERLPPERARFVARAAGVGAAALALFFAVQARERAELWLDEGALLADAAQHYPEGETATYLRACDAGMAGDAEAAVALLREAEGKGLNRAMSLNSDPCFREVQKTPVFRALVDEMAGRWIADAEALEERTHSMLRAIARAHVLRGEFQRAQQVLREALELGGPLRAQVRSELAQLRVRRAERRRMRRIRGERARGAADAARPEVLRGAVVVVLDTLRADRLSAYGYERETSPSIDGLAGEGVLFEQAISNAPRTLPAMVGLLSGRYPSPAVFRGRLRSSLVENLADAGFATAAFTEGAYVSEYFGMNRGFHSFVETEADVHVGAPPSEPGEGGVARTFADAADWLRQHAEEPFFLLVHTYEVHTPYRRTFYAEGLDSGKLGPSYEIEDLGRVKLGELELGPVELAYLSALYDGGIREADRKVGELLGVIEELGLSDLVLVVVTSDHGEGLGDRFPGWAGSHGHLLYEELVRVPLVLRDPRHPSPGLRVQETVRLVDVMPTVLDLLDVSVPAALEGRSLAPLLKVPRRTSRVALAAIRGERDSGRTTLRGANFKLIVSQPLALPRTPDVELYSLRDDPRERHNLAGAEPLKVEELQLRLRRALRREKQSFQLPMEESESLPVEVRTQLEALGYLEPSQPAEDAASGD